MNKRREYNLLYPEEEASLVKRLTLTMFLILVVFFLSTYYFNKFLPSPEDMNGATIDLVEDEIISIEREFYFMTEIPELDDITPIDILNITDTPTFDAPSMIFTHYNELEKEFDENKEDMYNELLEKGHLVLFIGHNLEPEKVAEVFIRHQVPVVPLESNQPIYYHSYGAVYSKEIEEIIPIFFASNNKDKINQNDFINLMNEIGDKYMATDFGDVKL